MREAWAPKKKEDNSQRPQHSENMWEVKTELNFYFHFQKKKATTVTHKGSLGRRQLPQYYKKRTIASLDTVKVLRKIRITPQWKHNTVPESPRKI